MERLWELFHNLWTRDVGRDGYNKSNWLELEKLILNLTKSKENLCGEILMGHDQNMMPLNTGPCLLSAGHSGSHSSSKANWGFDRE